MRNEDSDKILTELLVLLRENRKLKEELRALKRENDKLDQALDDRIAAYYQLEAKYKKLKETDRE